MNRGTPLRPLPVGFFSRDPLTCARELIGAAFVWNGVGGIIVETEAYAAEGDEACHTFSRPSSREFVRLHPPGTAYVYLNYGMYWLANALVKGGSADGFVLFRALQPVWGINLMRQRRGREKETDLCSGPGKLTLAIGLDGSFHGQSLSPLLGDPPAKANVVVSPRVGISKAKDFPWRFTLQNSDHVSVKPKDDLPK